MSKGGGGGFDTSGLEEATAAATQLQREMHEQNREDVQPWYQMGVGSVGKLSDFLGLPGGSMQSRDQIYDSLKDQYTTQSTATAPTTGMWQGYGGQIFANEQDAINASVARGGAGDEISRMKRARNEVSEYAPAPAQTSTTNYDALNAAVDAQLADQETPGGYGSLLQSFDMDKFEQDPGYQFRQQEAQKALERGMAAQGVTLGGGGYGGINPQVARALEEQSQGLASQEYANAYNRYNIDQTNVYNRLMGAAGMGQASTGQMIQSGQNYANNVGNLQTGLASAQANSAAAQASQPSMFDQLLSAGVQAGVAAFSDIRLKENIEHVGEQNGYPIYEFNYINIPEKRYSGVMAQDVEKVMPEAVVESEGMKMVNYDMIGVEMREV